jgi:hypothetical protein
MRIDGLVSAPGPRPVSAFVGYQERAGDGLPERPNVQWLHLFRL